MRYETILVEREERLTIVTINRPEAYNALNSTAQLELQAAFDEFSQDDEQWVAILTGAGGKAFCGGLDLKAQAEKQDFFRPERGFGGLTERHDLIKPVIAAVSGVAMGGGFELALACDLIVASPDAKFALPEARVGLAALGGGIQRLPQLIGLKRAMALLLTGRRVSAREGLEMGFVNEVVEGDVLEAAKRWAAEILASSPLSVRATKDAVHRGLSSPLSDAISDQWHYPAMAKMLASQDAVDGPLAFAEKRVPVWKGY